MLIRFSPPRRYAMIADVIATPPVSYRQPARCLDAYAAMLVDAAVMLIILSLLFDVIDVICCQHI